MFFKARSVHANRVLTVFSVASALWLVGGVW